jgi:hypothetical protein
MNTRYNAWNNQLIRNPLSVNYNLVTMDPNTKSSQSSRSLAYGPDRRTGTYHLQTRSHTIDCSNKRMVFGFALYFFAMYRGVSLEAPGSRRIGTGAQQSLDRSLVTLRACCL